MKLSLESRTDLLKLVQPLADFSFILAQEVLKDEEYAQYFAEDDKVKYLDNGLNENGEPMSIEDLKQANEKVGGDCYIIAPDWRGEAGKTFEAYVETCKEFGEDRVIGVMQGSTPVECLSCTNVYKGVIAIPYRVLSGPTDLPDTMALRRALLISNMPNGRLIHLLGLTVLEELEWYENRPNVMSIDTGVPILMGLREEHIEDGLKDKSQPTHKLAADLELTQKGYLASVINIATLRRHMPS